MGKRRKLTGMQAEVLDFIRSFIFKNGWPPTRKEIGAHFGYKSPNAAQTHLNALCDKGHISILKGASRGIKVIKPKPLKVYTYENLPRSINNSN